ncbi:hypothetical protein DJ531_06505 [Sulfolobus sp. A20-N-F6]|nr:hypothetical protein DJ531_06505 [Sulfolobus sp. A20-N-F6]
MKEYMKILEDKEREMSMKRTLDFLIALTSVLGNSNTSNLLEEILVYITTMKGGDVKAIYETTIKKLKPIENELNYVLEKTRKIEEVEKISKNIKLYGKILNIMLLILVISTSLSFPIYIFFPSLPITSYYYYFESAQGVIILFLFVALLKEYKKIDINVIFEDPKRDILGSSKKEN